jgi:uncharacterized protein YcbX
MRVRDLFIYPLKSGAGLRVADATLDALGFSGDRRWMVVDRDGQFLSQRRVTRMALIQVTLLRDEALFLSFPGVQSLRIARPDNDAKQLDVVVWDDVVRALDGGDEAAAWASGVLGLDARVVYCPTANARLVDPTYSPEEARVGFADGFPLLVVGGATLDDINARLVANNQQPIGVERFRPNIVIEGAEPYAEDSWRELQLETEHGAIRIDIVKPCARCSIISNDPRTGVQGVEPMRTLQTYRRHGKHVYVAQNAIPRSEGRIVTGASVTVVRSATAQR